MPHYYIMPLEATIADVAQNNAPSAEEVANNTWLPESDLEVYSAKEFQAHGVVPGWTQRVPVHV